MTRLGTDISSYQDGLDLADLKFAKFVIAKCSQGTGYTDANYRGWRAQARQLRLPFGWYHFLEKGNTGAQVAHTLACVGGADAGLPGMLDVEPYNDSRPGVADVLDYALAAEKAGLNLKLVYFPHWYWAELGSPDLSALTKFGLTLVASSYPGGVNDPASLYPGDRFSGWNSYGGAAPGVLQYTSTASDGGYRLDYNAIRDDSVFNAIFTQGAPDMTLAPDERDWLNNLYSAAFRGGPSCGRPVPSGHAGASEGGGNSIFAHLDYLTELLESLAARPAGAPVDVPALAAALVSKLDVANLAAQIATHIDTSPGYTAESLADVAIKAFAAQLAKP